MTEINKIQNLPEVFKKKTFCLSSQETKIDGSNNIFHDSILCHYMGGAENLPILLGKWVGWKKQGWFGMNISWLLSLLGQDL